MAKQNRLQRKDPIMIGALIPTIVVAGMIYMLLYPASVQNVMMWRIPPESRPDPNRSGMRLVPSIVIFVFGIAMFRMWDQALHGLLMPSLTRSISFGFFLIPAAFFLVLGLWGANWPISFMERMAPALRGKTQSLDGAGIEKVSIVGKCFAVICLLVAAYVLHRVMP